jgi:hypothetical protein
MRISFIILLFLYFSNIVWCQNTGNTQPLSIAYFGQYAIQAGLKIGTEFEVQAWKNDKQESRRYTRQYISPQLGVFFRPNTNTNIMLSGELGHQWTQKELKRFSAVGVGVGYIYQSQVLSESVNLSNGEVTKTRERRHFFVPTLSYTFGGRLNLYSEWYTKFIVGPRFSSTVESALAIFLEAGIRIPIILSK